MGQGFRSWLGRVSSSGGYDVGPGCGDVAPLCAMDSEMAAAVWLAVRSVARLGGDLVPFQGEGIFDEFPECGAL